jgi:YVTN family beta-propeller protein
VKKVKIIFLFVSLLWQTAALAQTTYLHDRVYTANQVSNTISVIAPSNNAFLGEIRLGKPYPNVLNPLYKGQALVHGLRYAPHKKMLAAIGIGSNSLVLIATETNKVLKVIYLGRSPHEPTFTPDEKQIWISVRGEAYVSVVDVNKMAEIKRVAVADGPGMVTFTNDGKYAYVCSSFTPEVDIVSTSTYQIVKRIAVNSPFSPNIYTSPDNKWIAMTHKDVGKVTILSTQKMAVEKVITTGVITNHVSFSIVNGKLLMLVTVGGENKLKLFDVDKDFIQIGSIDVGSLPHGLWPSPDGKILYVGLEYGDQVQKIDLQTQKVIGTVAIGQSPQALVYASNAVGDGDNHVGLSPLNDSAATQVVTLKNPEHTGNAIGRLSIRSIGLTDLIEQIFTSLSPNTSYTLALSKSANAPFQPDYEINTFDTDGNGRYVGQSTGLIKKLNDKSKEQPYQHVVLLDTKTGAIVLSDL